MDELNDDRPMLDCLLAKEQSAQYQHHHRDLNAGRTPLRWRRKICEWYYEFVDYFNFDREVVGVAMNYFDRYISSQQYCEYEHNILATYQTVAATALFLAIKLHATSCEISEEDISALRKRALGKILYGTTKPQDILDMEMNMLYGLDWKVNPPTLHNFAFMFCKFHPLSYICAESGSYLYEATRYQVELAIFMPELLANFNSSVIAYAALKNAEEKIYAENPLILTEDGKRSLEAPTLHSEVVMMDPSQVIQCQMMLKRVCQLPDLDYFSDTDRKVSNSPTNVVDFCD